MKILENKVSGFSGPVSISVLEDEIRVLPLHRDDEFSIAPSFFVPRYERVLKNWQENFMGTTLPERYMLRISADLDAPQVLSLAPLDGRFVGLLQRFEDPFMMISKTTGRQRPMFRVWFSLVDDIFFNGSAAGLDVNALLPFYPFRVTNGELAVRMAGHVEITRLIQFLDAAGLLEVAITEQEILDHGGNILAALSARVQRWVFDLTFREGYVDSIAAASLALQERFGLSLSALGDALEEA